MAQTVAVVRNTLTATLSGTTDFTKASFGTPSAAIIITCDANTTNNPSAGARMSIGFWDGTNQRTIGAYAVDAQATSDTARSSDSSYGLHLTNTTGAANSAYTVSSITDGIRLTMSIDNTGAQRYATVLLIAGVSAKVLTFTPNATQDATQESASLGFAPKLILFSTIGETSAAINASATALFSFGLARNDNTHRCLNWRSSDNIGDELANIYYAEDRCCAQTGADATSWGLEVTTFGSDTFTATTRDAATGGDLCFALALGGADLSFDVGTLTTPTGTGNSTVTTTVAPDAIMLALSTATATGVATGADANGYMLGLADDNGQFSHNISLEDAAATTNTNSAAQAAAVLDLDSSSGGTRTEMCDATVTLNSSDFTLNYSATDSTPRKGLWLAFGPAAAAGLTYPQLERHTLRGAFRGMSFP